jgi:hypothetical protein
MVAGRQGIKYIYPTTFAHADSGGFTSHHCANTNVVRNFFGRHKTSDLMRFIFLGLGLITFVTTILFCGVSRDTEFYEHTIFIKYRPTMKLYFYTPIGESDLKLSDLTDDKKKEEIFYQEFIDEQGVYSDNVNRLWFLPPILIQLTLTFLSLAITGTEVKKYGVLIHFLINIIFSAVGLIIIIDFDKFWLTLSLVGLLTVNIWTTKFVRRKSSAQHCVCNIAG